MSHEPGNRNWPIDGLDWDEESDDAVSVPDDEEGNTSGDLVDLELPEQLPLGDGEFTLLTRGPGAGSVQRESSRATTDTSSLGSEIRTRDEALKSGRPILLLQRGGQHWQRLPQLSAILHGRFGDAIELGALVTVPSATAESNERFLGRLGVTRLAIADPQTYLLDTESLKLRQSKEWGDRAFAPAALRRAPYLAEMEDEADWIHSVLDAQRAHHASILLSPGRALNIETPGASIQELFRHAEICHSMLSLGEHMGLNVTISWRWLANTQLREQLLNELVDHDEFDVWFVRVQWPRQRSLTQPTDVSLLEGYREIAQLAADEDRALLLPQSGLTGLVMTALGARGFGTGVSGTHQSFVEPSFGRSPGATRAERYLVPQLLHYVDRTALEMLREEPDLVECNCIYSQALRGRDTAWSHEYAGLHGIYATASLAASMWRDSQRRGPRDVMRKTVKAAERFSQSKDLIDISEPHQLAPWGQLLK